MKQTSKKMLLAVDGTAESLAVVKYVSESFYPAGVEICVYHVISKVPEVFWDLGHDSEWSEQIEAIRGYEQKQEEMVTAFVKDAEEILLKAGHKPGNVTTRIEAKHEGVARDILAEAKRGGYDVMVIGRGQVGSLPNMPLGSVATKILSAAAAPSICLVGGKPSSDKVLVALDASPDALNAVSHAGQLFNRGDNAITLFHAIRGIAVSGKGMEDIFPDAYRKRLLEDAEQGIRTVFEKAETLLKNYDIAPARISTKIVTSVTSRAEAVASEAKSGGYGTIVAGRRGHSRVADFSMGRVTNKLIQLAKGQCLCIVG